MRKLMVLVAMLAMMMAFAAPAFAQAVAIDEGDDVEFNGVGQNIVGSVGDIDTGNTATATATANATASGDSAAAAEASAVISQDSGVSISQSNSIGNGFFWWWF